MMESLGQRAYTLRYELLTLTVLAIVVGLYLIYGPSVFHLPTEPVVEKTLSEKIRDGEASIPEFTEATKAKLEKGPVFHALASFTDSGFEPRVIRIKRGETVRFTNNSSNNVWIASSGERVALYPRTQQTCGSTDLDSCEPFAPQDFWQFTFEVAGEWEVVNNLDKSKSGTVIVE